MVVGQKAMMAEAFKPMTQMPMTKAKPIARIPVLSLNFQPTRMEITIAMIHSQSAINRYLSFFFCAEAGRAPFRISLQVLGGALNDFVLDGFGQAGEVGAVARHPDHQLGMLLRVDLGVLHLRPVHHVELDVLAAVGQIPVKR